MRCIHDNLVSTQKHQCLRLFVPHREVINMNFNGNQPPIK